MITIDELQDIWHLVSKLHNGQKYGGSEPDEQIEYINHIGSVTFEILNAIQFEPTMNTGLVVRCAMLHDAIEDTPFSYDKILQLFGIEVADGVSALTKYTNLQPKERQMEDSLRRIKQQPKEIWAVKLADRIVNLYAPPYYWNDEKKTQYRDEAKLILNELRAGNSYLAQRLEQKIDAYSRFIQGAR